MIITLALVLAANVGEPEPPPQPPDDRPSAAEVFKLSIDLAETAEKALIQRDTERRRRERLERAITAASQAIRKEQDYSAKLHEVASKDRTQLRVVTHDLNVSRVRVEDLEAERWLWLTGGVVGGAVAAVVAVLLTR